MRRARRPGRRPQPRAPARRRDPAPGAHAGTRRRAARPRRLRRPAPPRRDHRPPQAVRAAQPGVPQAGRRPPPQGASCTTTAGARAARNAVVTSSKRRWPRIRSPTTPHARQKLRAGERSSGSSATAAHRATGPGPQREPGPPVRPRARRPRGVGLRRRLGAHRRRGAPGPPLHRDRPAPRRGAARGAARRPAPARAGRGRLVLHLRATGPRRPAPDAAGALADQTVARARPGGRAHVEDLRANEDDAGLPETRVARSGLHAVHLRLGRGRVARRRARRRRDDRRRLRAPREAVHRPASPGRRRRAGAGDPGQGPRARPTRATAAWSRRPASPARDGQASDGRAREVEKGKPWERPASGPAELAPSPATTPPSPPRCASTRARGSAFAARAPSPISPGRSGSSDTEPEPGGAARARAPVDALRVVADGRASP